jgi:hypothetical protein
MERKHTKVAIPAFIEAIRSNTCYSDFDRRRTNWHLPKAPDDHRGFRISRIKGRDFDLVYPHHDSYLLPPPFVETVDQLPSCTCQWYRPYPIDRNLFPSRPLSLMTTYFAENWFEGAQAGN